MKTIRTGVVGVGHMGANHARIYSEISTSRLTAVYDQNPEAAAAAAKRFHCQAAESLETFASMVDAATICTQLLSRAEPSLSLRASSTGAPCLTDRRLAGREVERRKEERLAFAIIRASTQL